MFHSRICLSAVPPPDASVSCCQGHLHDIYAYIHSIRTASLYTDKCNYYNVYHARALTAAIWVRNEYIGDTSDDDTGMLVDDRELIDGLDGAVALMAASHIHSIFSFPPLASCRPSGDQARPQIS